MQLEDGPRTSAEEHAASWSNGNPLERKVDQAVKFAIKSAKHLISWLPGESGYLRNKTVLEVGPGQDLGIPLILMGFGASIILVDRYLCQWDPDFHPLYYRNLRQEIADIFPSVETDPLDQVVKKDSHAIPNLAAMKVGMENIHEVPDSSVDVTYSNATFEHLTDPARAIQELARVTRPGGLGFHQIDFRDHRNFERPLEYLTISPQNSELQLKRMAWTFGNGVRSTEFEAMFRAAGFRIVQFDPNLLADEEYLAALQPRLQPKYKTMPPEALRVLGGRFFTLKPFSEDSHLHSIFSAYADHGYPIELVTNWALPARDSRKLAELLEEKQPERVLEIGTFVGLSTMMMAAKLHDEAVIHTVDPNLPLAVALEAMNIPARDVDLTMRRQELASAIAQQVGLAHKIVFHAGEFSAPVTVAPAKHEGSVPVIGVEICQKHGPFDLICIDGFHSGDAVLSDLRLASRYLSPRGRIVVHDAIGLRGGNVRRAVFQFLVEAPEFFFQHARYADVNESIGVLEQLPDHSPQVAETKVPPLENSVLRHPGFMERLAAVVYRLCTPKSAIYLGVDRGRLLPQLSTCGVGQVMQVQDGAYPVTEGPAITEHFDFGSPYKPKQRFDLCICLVDHDLTRCSLPHLVASCVACSDIILFGSTPPGEAGIAGERSFPIEKWVREFWKYGYRFYDQIRPHFELPRLANVMCTVHSSELSNLYLIRRESEGLRTVQQDVEAILVEKERRIEDLVLQGLSSDVALRHMQMDLTSSQAALVDKDKARAKADRIVTEQEALIHQCEDSIKRHEDTIREKDECLRQKDKIILDSTKEIEERDHAIARIEQSPEYRIAMRLGKYPRLMRLGTRLWQAMFRR